MDSEEAKLDVNASLSVSASGTVGAATTTSRLEMSRLVGKRKVNFITVEEKYKAIKALERKETTLMQLCAKLDVGKSTVFGWLNQKEKIFDEYENNPLISKRMKVRGSKYKEIEELIIDWIKVNKTSGIVINGSVIINKADEFAQLLGDHEFKANNGWLNRFRKKFQTTLREIFNYDTDSRLTYTLADRSLASLQMEDNGDDNENEDAGTLSSTTLDEEKEKKNGEFDDFNEVEELYDDGQMSGSIPSKTEVRTYIAKMRLFYQNKIDECNQFLKQLDVMESDL